MSSVLKSSRSSILLAVFLLIAAGYSRAIMPKPADATPYLQRVQAAASAVPMRSGDWLGSDVPLPQTAVTLLRPNVLFSRDYINLVTQKRGTFLLVHCGDARDLQGHYPPICYVSNGYVQEAAIPFTLQIGKWNVLGVEYHFAAQPLSGRPPIIVMDTMLLPDGTFQPDMTSVRRAASRLTGRTWGAGQIQVVFSESTTLEERQSIFGELLEVHRKIISEIFSSSLAQKPADARAELYR